MKKPIIIFFGIIAVLSIGGIALVMRGGNTTPSTPNAQGTNVSVVEGKQIVEITAKGGYAPRMTLAKADTPTTIRVKTNGTFDCSSALTIPSLGITKHLPPSGETTIDVPAQKQGTTLRGLCAMGMYNFTVNFN